MEMKQVEEALRGYAKLKAELEALKADLDQDVLALRRKYDSRLRSVLNRLTERHADIYRMIAENPGLFRKPRTIIVEGIRAGLKAGRGSLQIADAELTLKLIRKHFGDRADILIRTLEEPAKSALQQLEEAELRKIAVEITGREDRVVIEPVDSVVDKILSSALKIQIEDLKEEMKEAA